MTNGIGEIEWELQNARRRLAEYKRDLPNYRADLKQDEADLAEAETSGLPESVLAIARENVAEAHRLITECVREIPFLRTQVQQLELALQAEKENWEAELQEALRVYRNSPEGLRLKNSILETLARAQKIQEEIAVMSEESRAIIEEGERVLAEIDKLKKEKK